MRVSEEVELVGQAGDDLEGSDTLASISSLEDGPAGQNELCKLESTENLRSFLANEKDSAEDAATSINVLEAEGKVVGVTVHVLIIFLQMIMHMTKTGQLPLPLNYKTSWGEQRTIKALKMLLTEDFVDYCVRPLTKGDVFVTYVFCFFICLILTVLAVYAGTGAFLNLVSTTYIGEATHFVSHA